LVSLRRLSSRGLDWLNLFHKGFVGKSRPVGPAKPVEVKSHDKTVSRYCENQRTRSLDVAIARCAATQSSEADRVHPTPASAATTKNTSA
jgi:hypothetical protein